MSRVLLTVTAAAALLGGVADAAGYDETRNLDIYRGPVISDSRVVGLAGAYTAIAEGQIGQPHNQAALAHRRNNLDRAWDWDFIFLFPIITTVSGVVLDTGAKAAGYERILMLQLGLSGQYRRNGVGLHFQQDAYDTALASVDLSQFSVGYARAFKNDQLLLGAALLIAAAQVGPRGKPGLAYSGLGAQAGALWRPTRHNYRLGLSVRLPMGLDPASRPAVLDPDCGGAGQPPCVVPFKSAHLPFEIALGGVYRFGFHKGAFNRLAPVARRELEAELEQRGEKLPPEEISVEPAPGPFMLSVELVNVGPSADAVGIGGFVGQFGLDPQTGQAPDAPASGSFNTVSIRAGLEWEPLERRLRLRVGSYYEPTRYAQGAWRLHGTGGLDWRFWWQFRISAAVDLAKDYSNILFALGLWFP